MTDYEVESDGTVASGGVGERVSSSAVIGGICVAVNPGIAVAMALSICSYCAVIDGENQCVVFSSIGAAFNISCSVPFVGVTSGESCGGTMINSEI